MILDHHYAVVFRPQEKRFEGEQPVIKQLLGKAGYEALKRMAKEGHFVILEAWDITKGKCESN